MIAADGLSPADVLADVAVASAMWWCVRVWPTTLRILAKNVVVSVWDCLACRHWDRGVAARGQFARRGCGGVHPVCCCR